MEFSSKPTHSDQGDGYALEVSYKSHIPLGVLQQFTPEEIADITSRGLRTRVLDAVREHVENGLVY